MKKIDFETVSSFCCKRKGVIFKSIKGQKVGNYNRICKSTKTLCCQDTCPIWNSLEDVAPAEKEMTCDGCLFKNIDDNFACPRCLRNNKKKDYYQPK